MSTAGQRLVVRRSKNYQYLACVLLCACLRADPGFRIRITLVQIWVPLFTFHADRDPNSHFNADTDRAGHSLIFSRFAIRSPLNFFPWIADAHAFIFWISLFARRSNARRSTSGSLSEKGLNPSSLSIWKKERKKKGRKNVCLSFSRYTINYFDSVMHIMDTEKLI